MTQNSLEMTQEIQFHIELASKQIFAEGPPEVEEGSTRLQLVDRLEAAETKGDHSLAMIGMRVADSHKELAEYAVGLYFASWIVEMVDSLEEVGIVRRDSEEFAEEVEDFPVGKMCCIHQLLVQVQNKVVECSMAD
jgi:hypothetical protein